jgi:RNA polymerase sigma factor for flagellar operon FliA
VETLKAYSQLGKNNLHHLVLEHAQLVKKIAHHLRGRLPQTVMLEDLMQAGMIGLLEAAKKFDEGKGASFETYAGIRIRGYMLDEVRLNDWVPRSVYKNSRVISEAVKKIENKLGRDAKDYEIAEELGMSVTDYHSLLKNSSATQLYGFDDLGISDDAMSGEGESSANNEPLSEVQKDDLNRQLIKIIGQLPEREKMVLSLYYEQELNLKEIGEVLGVSESRVSQIHSQAMIRVKARMDYS